MLITRYTAILDACVLHSVRARAVLLWLAKEQLFRPLWSRTILDEWATSLARRKEPIPVERIAAHRQVLEENFPDALVEGYETLIPAFVLPDVDDRHVLAAAVVGRANAIVTMNLKDFPRECVQPYCEDVIHPDQFIVNLIDLDPAASISAFKQDRTSQTRSRPDVAAYLDAFTRAGLSQARARIEPFADLI